MAARFAKAAPAQAALKVAMFGPPGSGKSFTSLLMAEGLAKAAGRRVAYVDTERGTDYYTKEVKQRAVHPGAFDFDAIYTRSLAEVIEAVKSINPAEHGVVVIDSISHLWDSAQEAYTGKRAGKDGDKIPFGAWAALKRPFKKLIADLMAAPYHVFILGRQKNLYEDDGDAVRKVGVAMKAEADTPYEPHICLRMQAMAGEKPNTFNNVAFVEKDRSGVLSGKMLVNPSFATIEPLLSLLGSEQAPAEDEDERIAADSELLTQAEDKAAQKAERSRELLTSFQARILSAANVEELGVIGVELKKQKKYVLEEHVEALRQTFEHRRGQIIQSVAPGVS
jgi:hypothetical protein